MRYIFNSKDNEGIVGIAVDKWAKEGKIELIEKADPAVEISAKLERVQKALEALRKSGWNRDVMVIYIADQTKLGKSHVRAMLESQQAFFRAIGVKS